MHETTTADIRRQSRRQLAELIMAIQTHPLTPAILVDSITNALIQATPQADLTGSPEGIEIFLAAHERREQMARAGRA